MWAINKLKVAINRNPSDTMKNIMETSSDARKQVVSGVAGWLLR